MNRNPRAGAAHLAAGWGVFPWFAFVPNAPAQPRAAAGRSRSAWPDSLTAGTARPPRPATGPPAACMDLRRPVGLPEGVAGGVGAAGGATVVRGAVRSSGADVARAGRQNRRGSDDLTAETVADKIGRPAGRGFQPLDARGDRPGVC